MIDYEDMILTRQEYDEDCYNDVDECSNCKLANLCEKASRGEGEYPSCPYQ